MKSFWWELIGALWLVVIIIRTKSISSSLIQSWKYIKKMKFIYLFYSYSSLPQSASLSFFYDNTCLNRHSPSHSFGNSYLVVWIHYVYYIYIYFYYSLYVRSTIQIFYSCQFVPYGTLSTLIESIYGGTSLNHQFMPICTSLSTFQR